MTAAKDTISVCRVKELLSYDPDSGLFYRNAYSSPRAPAGLLTGTANSQGYLRVMLEGHRIYLHRVAWCLSYGYWPILEIDHINCKKSDNRLENLREANRSENSCNKKFRSDNASMVKGISWHKKNRRWQSDIEVQGRKIYLGSFNNKEDAAEAYRVAAEKYHGAFAKY